MTTGRGASRPFAMPTLRAETDERWTRVLIAEVLSALTAQVANILVMARGPKDGLADAQDSLDEG